MMSIKRGLYTVLSPLPERFHVGFNARDLLLLRGELGLHILVCGVHPLAQIDPNFLKVFLHRLTSPSHTLVKDFPHGTGQYFHAAVEIFAGPSCSSQYFRIFYFSFNNYKARPLIDCTLISIYPHTLIVLPGVKNNI